VEMRKNKDAIVRELMNVKNIVTVSHRIG